MGISYKAAIVVGVSWDDLYDHFNEQKEYDKLENLLDYGDLEMFTPYYDGVEDALVGLEYISTSCYQAEEFEYIQAQIEELKRLFYSLTGMHGKVWLTPVGS